MLSKSVIWWNAVDWFSFGIGGSLGLDLHDYSVETRNHVGVFFAGNIHAMLRFSYKWFIIELEGRSYNLFRAFGGAINLGVRF